MSVINVIGCDPGASGALCLLRLDSIKKPKIFFLDNSTPIKEMNTWLVTANNEMLIRMSIIEDIHSLPLVSAKSNFIFGKNLGIVSTLLGLQEFGLDKVQPKVWQKYAGVPVKKKGVKRTPKQLKNIVAEICDRIYPDCAIRGPQGGLKDGRSDALLIAHYCAHKYM